MMKHQTMKDSIKHWCLHLNINNSDSSNHCNLKYKLPNLKKDGVRFMGYGMEHYLEKLIMLFGRYLLQKFRYALKNGKEARETILLIGYSPKDRKHKRKFNDQKQVKPVWNNSKRVNQQNFGRFSHPNPKSNIVPQAVLTKSGLVSLNTAKSLSTAQPRTRMNDAMQKPYSIYKAYSSVKRPLQDMIMLMH
ncbi:hypothetical protein Tco_0163674 [Tanacetum coccineum]